MKLQSISTNDLLLYESFYCNPDMMKHLGNPWHKERMPQKLQRDVETVESGRAWIFKIIPDEDSGAAAGTVCIWEHTWNDESINEIGWMVLPQFQRRGLATQAVLAILDKARTEQRWNVIHAFPATANVASNAICRKTGFSKMEECDLEWSGSILHCTHWRTDLLPSTLTRRSSSNP